MEEVAGNAPCEYFEANVLAQSCCQNCFYPEEAHRPRHQCGRAVASALGAELRGPRGARAQPPPSLPGSQVSAASAAAATAQSRGLGGRQRGGLSRSPPGTRVLTADSRHRQSPPARGQSAGSSAEAPAGAPTAAPGHRSQEPETVPYLGGLASSLGGSSDEGPESGTNSSPDCDTPDDPSDSSSVDWDTVERPEEASSGDELTVMIPRKPQEGPRADSARRAPSLLTRSPVGGDTAGQRKEDTCSGSRSAGQHWAKLRGESGYFLERHRTTQRDNPRASCIQQNIPRTSSTQRDNPKTSYTQWNNLRTSYTQRDNPQSSSRRDNPRTSSPRCCTQRDHPRNSSPHRTNKDIPWASFPLRPTQTEGPRTSSPSRSKQSEVPWASIALRPTQGDRPPQTSSPTRPTQRDPPLSSSGSTRHNSPSPAASSSRNPGPHSASRTSSPLYPATRGAPQTSSEPSQPPCSVCIGHRDAPRASSPPRYLQHDPFPFFPDPHAPESESPHHNPPYIPPPVCIGHRDAPRASSPPRHTQFDPFPFLPDTSDAETQSPQHYLPQFPPPVCIGYRDAPRASSPPRQPPEPSLCFQDLPRASTESLGPSTDSLHEQPHMPTPVCIGHRDAPSFSSPPRQAPEPSLFFQDPPGTSMESLAPSTDSRHGSPVLPPQVCIGHRDAPRASSPPRHPPSDLALLEPSPPPGSSGGSRGSAAPGETRHNLEREEYTVLADLPPPRRLAQREPGPQCSNGGRTRSPGRAEVERLFGQERR
uniref:TRIO and F-actin-binding protein-like n=1 Tax=Odobenus rosmarus divergens TaxID=9708 RepID=UPI00063C2F36|nr:PREDICTED: TRIO and F-actin-binding protein-like [Odobenus rosmarus divergens]